MIIDGFSFGIGSVVGFFGALLITFILYWIFKNALEQKRASIDTTVAALDEKLEKMDKTVRDFERDRDKKYGALEQSLSQLNTSTGKLGDLLNNNQKRGAWGERLAEDILKAVGFEEETNYTKQQQQEHKRPDFTFMLPDKRKLNMDVKFPLESYQKYLEVESETDKDRYCKEFLKAVEKTIKDVSGREYIDDDTLDFVLLFIPNEAIYRFIHEQGESMIDEALKKRVVLCSPVTLYTILLIVRQASKNFKLEQSSREILRVLSGLKNEWEKYLEETEDLRKSLEKAQKSFDSLMGTRKRQLDRAINQIDNLQMPDEIQPTN